MSTPLRAWLVAALLAVVTLCACAETDLQPVPGGPLVPRDDRLSISGQFCLDRPTPAEFPVRILFVVDISQSMNVSDPPPAVCPTGACFSRRGQAVEAILNKYPAGQGVSYGLVTFSSDSAVQTHDTTGQTGFTQDTGEILTRLPALSSAMGQTNFAGALKTTYEMLQADMIALDATARSRARYVVVFISDGLPSPRTSEHGLPPEVSTAVSDIAGLQQQQRLADISLHTIYLAGPTTPPAVQLVAKELMAEMAHLANGSSRSFDSTESINLFYIDFTSFIRQFSLKQFVISNSNSKSLEGRNGLDTDGDGLLDEEELLIGTSPSLKDTDGDGFSDLLEVRLRSSGFDPLFPADADCAGSNDRRDDDGDGLANCEERYLGTDYRVIDSDADGFTDDTEVRAGTNPTIADSLVDSDFDSAPNGIEIGNHTDPARNDIANFSKTAYRYNLTEIRDDSVPAGQTCYAFEASNIALVASQALQGLPAGTNTIYLWVATAPSDSPDDYGNHQVACVRPRYRNSPEEKVPASGHMIVPREKFVKPGLLPDGTEGFDANRDCVVP
jgi:hypothetical protein